MSFSCMKRLLGTHIQAPDFQAVPPTASAFSSTTVAAPSSAACTATASPAADAPTATTSVSRSHSVASETLRTGVLTAVSSVVARGRACRRRAIVSEIVFIAARAPRFTLRGTGPRTDRSAGDRRSAAPSSWCHSGYGSGRRLTRSSASASSAVSTMSAAPRFASSCSSVLAPITSDVIPGRPSSHASAICAAGTPRSSAIPTMTSMCRRADPRRRSAARSSRRRGARSLRHHAAPVLARQQPAGQRAPDERPDAEVDRGRHDLVLGVARLQREVDLLRGERLVAMALRDARGLHQVPPREVRAADVAHLARAHECIERRERLLERGLPVPAVHQVEIDVVARARRRRLASQAAIRWCRESPASFGPSPIGSRTLVDTRMSSWRPPRASPRISSETAVRIPVRGVDAVDPRIDAVVDQTGARPPRRCCPTGRARPSRRRSPCPGSASRRGVPNARAVDIPS